MPRRRSKEAIAQAKLDMRAMIADCREQKQRYPTNTEFVKVLEYSERTVIKLKRQIYEEDSQLMIELFGFEKIDNVKEAIHDLKKNIAFYRKIRDGDDKKDIRMKAAQLLEESQQKLAQLLDSGNEYFEIEDESSITEKLFNRQEEKTQIPVNQ